MRKDVLAALLVISAVGAASATAVARPPASPAGAARQVAACTPAEECAGRLILAGGPPPWAPAHGYRRQHEHDRYEHPEHHVGVPDVGIELGQKGVQIIGVPRLDGALDGLHVLL